MEYEVKGSPINTGQLTKIIMCGTVMYVHSCRDKQMNIMLRLIGIYNDSLISIYNGTTVPSAACKTA